MLITSPERAHERTFEMNLANICPSHSEQSTSSLPLPAIIPPNVISLLLSNDSEAAKVIVKSETVSHQFPFVLENRISAWFSVAFCVRIFFSFSFSPLSFAGSGEGCSPWLKSAPAFRRAAGCRGPCRANRKAMSLQPVRGVPLG